MALPYVALEFARDRLRRTALSEATIGARLYDPEGAVEAGYLDRVVEPDSVVAAAMAAARDMAALDRAAFAETKRRLRGPTVERIRALNRQA